MTPKVFVKARMDVWLRIHGAEPTLTEEISLNEVLKQVMRTQPAMRTRNTIMRFEMLPVVTGNRQQLTSVFKGLFDIIFRHSPANRRLFLYMDCFPVDPGEKFPEDGIRRYMIQVHTNVVASLHWKQQYADFFGECRSVLNRHNGSFEVNEINNPSCLFTLSVPGKPE